jgi:hypothetical protein
VCGLILFKSPSDFTINMQFTVHTSYLLWSVGLTVTHETAILTGTLEMCLVKQDGIIEYNFTLR